MVGRGLYILKNKEPFPCDDISEWGRWHENVGNRIVRKTTVGDANISTVFSGIDHDFIEVGRPLVFETMIFGGEHNYFQKRYATWAEAEAGHELAVKMVGGEAG